MLYDRPYMRAERPKLRQPNQVVTWILLSNLVFFVLQQIPGISQFLVDFFALTPEFIPLQLWAIVSYGWLHDGFLHFFFNMLAIYLVGMILEQEMGARRFLTLYLGSIALGGLVWFLFTPHATGVVGASAGAFGLFSYFLLSRPNVPMTFLLFFVIPVTIRPIWLFWFLLVTQSLGMLSAMTSQMPNLDPLMLVMSPFLERGTLIAYSAHLGGILLGWFLYHKFIRQGFAFSDSRVNVEPPRWFRNRPNSSSSGQKFKVNVVSRNEMESEVNRILDKINQEGFGALTLQEKETLDRARDFLKR